MELLSAQSSASSHGGKCSLQTRRRSSTYRLSCVRELISITRVRTRSTRDHRPMLGDYASSCGSWSLYSATGNIPMALSEAIIATYMTIHMARSPVHTVRELRLLPGVAGGSFRAFWHHPPPTSKAPDRPDFHRRLRFTRRFARKGREVADRLRRLGRRERRSAGRLQAISRGEGGRSYP